MLSNESLEPACQKPASRQSERFPARSADLQRPLGNVSVLISPCVNSRIKLVLFQHVSWWARGSRGVCPPGYVCDFSQNTVRIYIEYYNRSESKRRYVLFLKGTKHFGYYDAEDRSWQFSKAGKKTISVRSYDARIY
jgi:hypothetical protein